jgi:hypothetical protein
LAAHLHAGKMPVRDASHVSDARALQQAVAPRGGEEATRAAVEGAVEDIEGHEQVRELWIHARSGGARKAGGSGGGSGGGGTVSYQVHNNSAADSQPALSTPCGALGVPPSQ